MFKFDLQVTSLTNGLKIFYIQNKNSSAFEIGMHVNTGVVNETCANNGISHFVEHMLFRGCVKHTSSVLLSAAMEKLGGEANASTNFENTFFWLNGSYEYLHEGINVFANMMLKPLWKNLNIERKIILEELAQDYNDKSVNINADVLGMAALFSDSSLGLPIIGIEKSIKKISKAQLISFYKQYYAPDNSAITCFSPYSFQEVKPWLDNAFGTENFKPNPFKDVCHLNNKKNINSTSKFDCLKHLNIKSSTWDRNSIVMQPDADNQYLFKLMCKTEIESNEDLVTYTFLQKLLDDGLSSRLPLCLREKYGLVYEVSAEFTTILNSGYFAIEASVLAKNLSKMLIILSKELLLCNKNGFTEDEINKTRIRYFHELMLIQENSNKYLGREVTSYFNKRCISLEDEINMVNKLSIKTLKQNLNKLLTVAERTCVLVGPHAPKKKELLKTFLTSLA